MNDHRGIHIRPSLKSGVRVARRLLGDKKGSRGPTMVVLAGVHGNEESGVVAVERVFERMARLDIELRGRLVALAGNMSALRQGVRFVDYDLNRMWRDDAPRDRQTSETIDFLELNSQFEQLAADAEGALTIIDLHSFSGEGQPFLIAPNRGFRPSLVEGMPFPVIKGLNNFVFGTLCGHLEEQGHHTLALEGGRESDPAVAVNIEAFLWQIMARIGVIDPALIPHPVAQTWRDLFREEGHLPRCFHTVFRHPIAPGDDFAMEPGYGTFHQVEEGRLLASDRNGPIHAPQNGWLLLPLYQGKGDDGFFIAHAEF